MAIANLEGGVAGAGRDAIIAAACSDSGTPENSPSGSTGGGAEIQAGGTLNLAQTSDVSAAFDPQKEYYQLSFEYFKCCLVRMLLSTKEVPVEDGGSELQPDLAADLPTVSDDGLTYTFTIKPGIMYAPPLQDVEVTAQDFIRAIEREADPKANSGGYPFYYSTIEGFDDYGAGKADTISGMSAPDDHTLVVKISEPAGDLPWRFAMPATAPIPPNPSDPSAVLGVADGHTTNYGRFLVSTGPYMFEGSEALDFSVPAKDQEPVSGYIPGRSIVLVRNPSYDPAYADAYTFGPPLFDASSLYPICCNFSLIGASEDQLTEWGYPAGTTVPDVGDRMKECAAIPVGDERYTCWANFDKYMMEEVVPWVPVTFSNNNDITSACHQLLVRLRRPAGVVRQLRVRQRGA